MASLEGQIAKLIIPEKKKFLSLDEIIGKYAYHWPLFLLALILILPVVYFYASTLSPIYEIKTSLLIKDDKKSLVKKESVLHEIDLINSSKTIENEIEILKSTKLITQVVQDLKLWINYQLVDGLKEIDLYNKSPFKITFINQNPNYESNELKIKIVDNKSFDLALPGGSWKRFQFGKIYKNRLGSWMINQTLYLMENIGDQINITIVNPELVVLKYQKLINAVLSNKLSSTIVISLNDTSPQRGKDILNQLLVKYDLASSTEKNKDIINTITFLDQKIAELSGDLGTSEKDIENYKSSKGLTDISLQSKVSLENLQANDFKLNEANIHLDIIKRIEAYVNSAQNSEKIPSANGIIDVGLANLIEKLSKLQLEYEELAATTPETSPDFEPINRQIKTTKQTIKETVKNIKLSLQSKKDNLQSYNSNFETSIKNIPVQEREYINIKRQQSSKEGLYTYYLQKREEASANYAATISDDKVIDEAYAGQPKNSKNTFYALGLVLALGMPFGLIYTRGLLTNKILSTLEISAAVNIPVIAEIPLQRTKNTISINSRDSTATSEQFRALRTRLHHLHGDKTKGRVTLVTSSIPGEGKSFISTNIGVSLAYTERKTIILELDMRKPKILEILKLPNDKLGLNDYFMRIASIEDIIQASGISSNLDVISSGVTTLNPSELLERPELKKLISVLQETYDDIIIDSPPIHLVPDAMIVSPFTDICLFIVRQGFTTKAEIDYLKSIILQNQLKNINMVFNGINKERFGYGYGYNEKYYDQTKKNTIFSDFWQRF